MMFSERESRKESWKVFTFHTRESWAASKKERRLEFAAPRLVGIETHSDSSTGFTIYSPHVSRRAKQCGGAFEADKTEAWYAVGFLLRFVVRFNDGEFLNPNGVLKEVGGAEQ